MNKYNDKYPMSMKRKDFGDCPCGNYKQNTTYNPIFLPEGIQSPMDDDDYNDFDYDENDRQYMLSLYPDLCKRIAQLSEIECDKLEYEGSLMFDEYPDKKEIDKIVARIYVIVEKEQIIPKVSQELESQERTAQTQQVIVPYGNPWLYNNVQVGFLNELFGRRRHRYPRRYQYPYYAQPYTPYRPYYYPYQTYIPYQPYVPYYYRYY